MTLKFSENKLVGEELLNPFKNDYTNRLEEIALGFTKLIKVEAKKQPLVMSLDAPWGVGKTTFIDMWGQFLLNSSEYAIKFDAWKNDYSDYPLLSFISQLYGQLTKFEKLPGKRYFLNTSRNLCETFLPALMKFGVQTLAAHYKLVKPLEELGKSLAESTGKKLEEEIKSYSKKSETLEEFKKALRKMAGNKIIYIFIDELDRCKPTFAVAILEIVKHIFDIENICCILSTNTDALSKSIESIYGYDLNQAKNYLERFIDIPIQLPRPDLKVFFDDKLKHLSSEINNKEYLERFENAVEICCNALSPSLRVIEKYFRDMRLFLTCNKYIIAEKRIPEIYYPCVARMIVEKRINDNHVLTKLNSDLCVYEKNKWVYQLFFASSSESNLLVSIDRLTADIRSINSKKVRGHEESIRMHALQSLKDEIVLSIYGGVHHDFVGSDDSQLNAKVKNYVNHFEGAKKIIDLLELKFSDGDLED